MHSPDSTKIAVIKPKMRRSATSAGLFAFLLLCCSLCSVFATSNSQIVQEFGWENLEHPAENIRQVPASSGAHIRSAKHQQKHDRRDAYTSWRTFDPVTHLLSVGKQPDGAIAKNVPIPGTNSTVFMWHSDDDDEKEAKAESVIISLPGKGRNANFNYNVSSIRKSCAESFGVDLSFIACLI